MRTCGKSMKCMRMVVSIFQETICLASNTMEIVALDIFTRMDGETIICFWFIFVICILFHLFVWSSANVLIMEYCKTLVVCGGKGRILSSFLKKKVSIFHLSGRPLSMLWNVFVLWKHGIRISPVSCGLDVQLKHWIMVLCHVLEGSGTFLSRPPI